jgi:hypothetical protein
MRRQIWWALKDKRGEIWLDEFDRPELRSTKLRADAVAKYFLSEFGVTITPVRVTLVEVPK